MSAAVMATAAVLLVAATLLMAPRSGYVSDLEDAAWILGAAVFATTGAIIVRSHRFHLVGWAFLWIGLLTAVTDGAASYGTLGTQRELPLAGVAAWVSTWTWAPGMGLIVLVVSVFPTGRPLSRRWGTVAWSGLAVSLTMATVNAVVFWPLRHPTLALPDEQERYDNIAITLIGTLFPFLILTAFAGMTSLVLRYRRSVGVERQQLKWLMVVAVVAGPAIVAGQFLVPGSLGRQVADILGGPIWLAAGAGVAVLRYRLYDIDRIISRTVSYGAVTAILLGVYALSVVGLGGLARGLSGRSNDLVVALSTLLVAAAFQPVRRRVQAVVDRRFNRARVDGLQAAEEFSRQLRDEVDLTTVMAELRAVVVRTLQPASASVVTVVGPGERS